MKKLVLHLGAHRCGSTAVQTLLRRESKALADAGVRVFLRNDMVAGKLDLRRLHRFRALNPLWRSKLKKTAAFIEATPERILIASEENLMGTMPAVRGHGFYPHFDKLGRSLVCLSDLMRGTVSIEPRLVVRRQDRYLESVYAFRVARGLSLDFDDYIRAVTRTRVSWLRLVNVLERLNAPITPKVALIEAWPKPMAADMALEFLLGENEIELSSHRLTGNTRHSAVQLRTFLALNQAKVSCSAPGQRGSVSELLATPGKEPEKDIFHALRDQLTTREYQRFEERYSSDAKLTFDEAERTAFLESYREENERLLSMEMVTAPRGAWS